MADTTTIDHKDADLVKYSYGLNRINSYLESVESNFVKKLHFTDPYTKIHMPLILELREELNKILEEFNNNYGKRVEVSVKEQQARRQRLIQGIIMKINQATANAKDDQSKTEYQARSKTKTKHLFASISEWVRTHFGRRIVWPRNEQTLRWRKYY